MCPKRLKTRPSAVFLIVACLGFLIAGTAAFAAGSPTSHLLDPLSREEIAATVEVLKAAGKTNADSRYAIIVLNEPSKQDVIAAKQQNLDRREAFVVVYERAANRTFEAVVDLKRKQITSWKEAPGVQPPMLLEDYILLQSIVRADPQWQAAIRKRGITDFEGVQLDPWSAGNFGFPEEKGVRIFRAVAYYKGNAKNGYGRPIEGIVAYVDLNKKKILKLVDSEIVPVARGSADFHDDTVGPTREAPKPLAITQPQGASFVVDGNQIRWQKWRFRYALHPREGLVLYTVGYEDEGKLRPILYRASLSEMVVPYGDPSTSWFFRNAFDEGEYGIGRFANSLVPLADAPANATYFGATLANEMGEAVDVPRAVALYERDGGLLWKHADFDGAYSESRRARELVLGWIATVGNYEYGFNWVFHQDGSLEMEALLTGIMQPKGVRSSSGDEHADGGSWHLVSDGVAAVHHQHFFNFRLDMDVDGTSNSVVEMNTEALTRGPNNPQGNAFVMKETLLGSEQQAQRQLNLASNRKWKVISSTSRNALGQPTGYILVPGENSTPYAAPDSSVRKRAGFIGAHLWVTQYKADEMHAAGDYINQSEGGEGLPRWTAGNRAVQDRDIVLWYTMGVTHIPRPEDWPVMPVHKAGFKLVPASFFSRNPALDVNRP